MQHRYEKLTEDGRYQYCPANDYDGSVTGHIVIGVRAWFDENPEERKRLGWIKHLYYTNNDELMADLPDYDPASQYLVYGTEWLDEYTMRDRYYPIDKNEEMMELEEKLELMNLYVPRGLVQLDAQGGVLV